MCGREVCSAFGGGGGGGGAIKILNPKHALIVWHLRFPISYD